MKVLKFIVVYAACLFLLSAFIGTGHPEWSYVFVGVISLVISIKIAEYDLKRIKTEGEQKIATAHAEAESIRVQSDAIRAQGGAEYVKLKAIEKWNGVLPQVAGDTGGLILNLN